MSNEAKPSTFDKNSRIWSARAQDWAELQEPIHRPQYEAVLRRTSVGTGTRYLDIGCGSGLAASLAAAHGANVAGIDASQKLLDIAKMRVPAGDFRQSDLETLPFPDGSFDVVTGFNSFQYAANAVDALEEARRVLAPDGTVAIVTWGQPEGMEAAELLAALTPLLPPAPPGSPGPFALSEEAALRGFAKSADLRPTELFDIDCPFIYPDVATGVRALCSGGGSVAVGEMVGDEAAAEAYRAALLRYEQPDGSVRVGASFRCLLAAI